jgi:NADPH:quinone reductase-like Zn-dependent oxidoreductase
LSIIFGPELLEGKKQGWIRSIPSLTRDSHDEQRVNNMKAVVFDQHGGPEVLHYRDLPVPKLSSGEVLIQVKATACNYNDIWAREGVPGKEFLLPHISGSDVAGVVEEVGSDVRSIRPGDEVVVFCGISCHLCEFCARGNPTLCKDFKIWGFETGPLDGGHAEYVKLPEFNVMPKPQNLSWEEAASFPLVLVTAWRMLVSRAKVKAGDFVLIWGSAGGLGTMAIQICRVFGGRAIAIASSEERLELAYNLGAEFLINRNKQRIVREVSKITNRQGVDIAFEHVGAASWKTSTLALKWGGTIVTCGATTGFDAAIDIRFLWNKEQNYLGSHLGNKAELLEAMRFVKSGQIKPVISEVLPLKEIVRAQEKFTNGESVGKIVLIP